PAHTPGTSGTRASRACWTGCRCAAEAAVAGPGLRRAGPGPRGGPGLRGGRGRRGGAGRRPSPDRAAGGHAPGARRSRRRPAPPPGETVATYAVQYTYTEDADRVAIYRPEHREHLAELHREGTLLLSGPLGDGPGALLIVVADSAEDALAALDGDPFKRERV